MEPETNRILSLSHTVPFADVDGENRLCLRGVFKLLQEAAISHANLFDTGTDAMLTRGESWVLNRLAVEIARYPSFGEHLRVDTWSAGIRGFRGLRDFRVLDGTGRLIAAGSSLWIFVNTRTQSIMRVPQELADRFPCVTDTMFLPGLESAEPPQPAADAPATQLSLRYSDFDANRHLNNAVYLDLLQAALDRLQLDPRPRRILIKYGRAIGRDSDSVDLRVDARAEATVFSLSAGGTLRASGACGPSAFSPTVSLD